MPPRVTLAWSRCWLCGRHAPTWRCVVGGRTVELCLFCAYTIPSARCGALEIPARGTAAQAPGPLEPDESLLEKYSSRTATAARRRRGGFTRSRRRSTR